MPNARNKATEVAERRKKVFDMKVRGLSYRTIGERLGISHETAHKDTKVVLTELASQTLDRAKEWRQLELKRLDDQTERIRQIQQDTKDERTALLAEEKLLRIAERRSKLLGLDEPERVVHIEGRPEQMDDDDIAGEVEEILKKRQEAVTVNGNGSSNGRSE